MELRCGGERLTERCGSGKRIRKDGSFGTGDRGAPSGERASGAGLRGGTASGQTTGGGVLTATTQGESPNTRTEGRPGVRPAQSAGDSRGGGRGGGSSPTDALSALRGRGGGDRGRIAVSNRDSLATRRADRVSDSPRSLSALPAAGARSTSATEFSGGGECGVAGGAAGGGAGYATE